MENKVILLGRVVEVKPFERKSIINLAVKNSFPNKEGEYETEFLDVNVFGKAMNYANQHLEKGSLCYITGRLHKNNRDNTYETQIIGEKIVGFGEKKKAEKTDNDELPF